MTKWRSHLSLKTRCGMLPSCFYPARAARVSTVVSIYIRECGSTLYVGLARAVSPTNTKLPVNFFTNLTSGGSL